MKLDRERVAAVIPAAGSSRRMGRDKLLLPWGDGTVIGSVAAALQAGGAARVCVVASVAAAGLRGWVRDSPFELATNPDAERGMLSSIWAGIEHLGGVGAFGGGSALLVCPGDHAGLEAATVGELVDALSAGAQLAVAAHGGRRGHPLAVSGELVPEIAQLSLDTGLKALLEVHSERAVEVDVDDPAVVRDLDRPEDYERARRP